MTTCPEQHTRARSKTQVLHYGKACRANICRLIYEVATRVFDD